MSNANTYKPEELDGYFSDPSVNTAAPEGFDPDASGFVDPSIGRHIFEVAAWSADKPAYELQENQQFKWDGQTYILNKLWLRFRIPKGQPEAGAKCMEFLPCPTPGQPMPTGMANRWANAIKALGFDLPPNGVVPPGFKFSLLTGRQCVIDIEHQTDANNEPKYRPNGKPQVGPAFFGFSRVPADGKLPSAPAPAQSHRNNGTHRTPPAQPAAVAAPSEFSDL